MGIGGESKKEGAKQCEDNPFFFKNENNHHENIIY